MGPVAPSPDLNPLGPVAPSPDLNPLGLVAPSPDLNPLGLVAPSPDQRRDTDESLATPLVEEGGVDVDLAAHHRLPHGVQGRRRDVPVRVGEDLRRNPGRVV